MLTLFVEASASVAPWMAASGMFVCAGRRLMFVPEGCVGLDCDVDVVGDGSFPYDCCGSDLRGCDALRVHLRPNAARAVGRR